MSLLKINKELILPSLIAALLISCGDSGKDNKPDIEKEKAEEMKRNDNALIAKVKNKFGEPAVSVLIGAFDYDTNNRIAVAGLEIIEKDDWSICFAFLDNNEGEELVEKWRTEKLLGSFNECLIKPISLSGFKNELVYYNSQNYYIGSAGGDIYAYIIDYPNKAVYQAHFFSYADRPVSLYVPKAPYNEEIVDFLTNEFKLIYPEVILTDKDYVYQNY